MENKLTIECLAPYLPYGLKCYADASNFGLEKPLVKEMDCYMLMNLVNGDTKYKITLHDLSSLTKPIIVEGYNGGEPFVPIDELEIDGCNISVYDGSIRLSTTEDCEFIYAMDVYNQIVQQLIKWHFNVFNIPSHLFIDKLNLK